MVWSGKKRLTDLHSVVKCGSIDVDKGLSEKG